MRLLIMGPQGVGKGTHAALLAEHFNIPTISTGDIFRYNISQNDGTGILTPVRNVDAKIYGNIFYIKEGVDFIRHRIWGDTMIEGGGIEVTDNIIIYAGNAPKEESWTYMILLIYHIYFIISNQ